MFLYRRSRVNPRTKLRAPDAMQEQCRYAGQICYVQSKHSGFCSRFSIHFMSVRGNILAIAFPLMSANGIGPYILESLDSGRLSPITQQ